MLIPIISSVIGGLITFLGVKRTINDQHNTDASKRMQTIKPWVYLTEANYNEDIQIRLKTNCDSTKISSYQMYLRNTDNGIAIIDSVVTENNVYSPQGSCVLEKNKEALIIVDLAANGTETLKDVRLVIKDVDGNKYVYQLIWGLDCWDYLVEVTK